MSSEKSLFCKVSTLQLLKNRTLSVFEQQDWYQHKKTDFCDLQSYREFFQFPNSEKNYAVWNLSFLGKNAFFWKKMYDSQTKMKFEKNSLSFCRAQISASIDTSHSCVGWTIRPFGSSPWTTFFLCFLWIVRFLWR